MYRWQDPKPPAAQAMHKRWNNRLSKSASREYDQQLHEERQRLRGLTNDAMNEIASRKVSTKETQS